MEGRPGRIPRDVGLYPYRFRELVKGCVNLKCERISQDRQHHSQDTCSYSLIPLIRKQYHSQFFLRSLQLSQLVF